MRRVKIHTAGVELSALVGGEGPAVVLLHGLAGCAAELLATAEALEPEHTVVVLDQRGHGHSTRRPADVSRAAYVADVIATLDASGLGSAVLAGQSMGAHTAMLTAARHPGRVDGLVMAEGGVGGDDGDYPSRLEAWFESWPVPFATVEEAAAFVPLAGFDPEPRPGGFGPRFDGAVLTAAVRAVAAQARWADWAAVTAPTLLLRAERGTGPEGELEAMLAARPGVRHAVIPGAGHDLHLDQPQLWLAALRGFMAEIRGDPAAAPLSGDTAPA